MSSQPMPSVITTIGIDSGKNTFIWLALINAVQLFCS